MPPGNPRWNSSLHDLCNASSTPDESNGPVVTYVYVTFDNATNNLCYGKSDTTARRHGWDFYVCDMKRGKTSTTTASTDLPVLRKTPSSERTFQRFNASTTVVALEVGTVAAINSSIR